MLPQLTPNLHVARMPPLRTSASHLCVQAELRAQIGQREAAWRSANPEHPADAPLPPEAKNRDVVWKALERKLQRVAA